MIASLVGGVLIGLAATFLFWTNGKIAGVSNIVDGAVRLENGHQPWFVGGLLLAGLVAHLLHPSSIGSFVSLPTVVVSGLLVGLGTRVANGCTSGHGVCGISRLRKRSIAATLTFMSAGFATVFVTEHVIR